MEFTHDEAESVCVATADHQDLARAFGHYRHYDEEMIRELLLSTGFSIQKMYRHQMLFESEMMHVHHAVRLFQSVYLWPLLLAISRLDCLLPKSYPGVGLLAVAMKKT